MYMFYSCTSSHKSEPKNNAEYNPIDTIPLTNTDYFRDVIVNNNNEIFLDSAVFFFKCSEFPFSVDSLLFYYKDKSYKVSEEFISYRQGLNESFFLVKHFNKDNFVDIYYPSLGSGNGCQSDEIFLYNKKLHQYYYAKQLGSECYLDYNHEFDIYSSYSRGSGTKGPWYYEIFKYNKKEKVVLESVLVERIIKDDSNNYSWKINHFYNNKNHIYRYNVIDYFESTKINSFMASTITKLKHSKPYYNARIN